MTHIQNELIDEACGRVIRHVEDRGWGNDTDVFLATDHGELQGDFGLLFKGPYHCEALMHIPLIWHPAPSANITPAEVSDPVGQVDLAPTFCQIVGIAPAEWMQGKPLPIASGTGHERMITEWDSQMPGMGFHLRSIYRDGYTCTVYEPSTRTPTGIPGPRWQCDVIYDGTEGELYHHTEDPRQWRNLWDDAGYAAIKADLIADLRDHLPPERKPRLLAEAPT